MKGLEAKHYKDACKEKILYHTWEDAWIAAYKFFKKYGTESLPYVCAECFEYHLTSMTRGRKSVVPKFLRLLIENNKI